VGAGSLILVLLLFLYPSLRNSQLVGTDLAQSVPLTLSATVGTLIFSHVSFSLTSSIIIGSVPMVIVGSLLSSRANGVLLRRIIMATVLLSGLKYVGLPNDGLGIVAAALAVAILIVGLRHAKEKRLAEALLVPETVEDVVALLPTGLDADPQL
jgi:uncharacterized membrane protein YfcA